MSAKDIREQVERRAAMIDESMTIKTKLGVLVLVVSSALVTVAGGAVAWANLGNRVTQIEAAHVEIVARQDKLAADVSAMIPTLARIDERTRNTERDVQDIKQRVK